MSNAEHRAKSKALANKLQKEIMRTAKKRPVRGRIPRPGKAGPYESQPDFKQIGE